MRQRVQAMKNPASVKGVAGYWFAMRALTFDHFAVVHGGRFDV